MLRQEIIEKIKGLNFPNGSFVAFGSAPLAAADIREAGDIDLVVTKELFAKLKDEDWQPVDKGLRSNPLVQGDFEAYESWHISNEYNPALSDLLADADYIDGIPFVSLQEVRKWKAVSARPKDLADIELIDQYLTQVK